MGDVNWGRVLFLSILGFMLVMMVVIGTASAASVWDSRDPEIQRAQGTVDGTNAYTVQFMKQFAAKAEALYGKERGTAAAALLAEFRAKLAEFEAYAAALLADPEVGTTLRPDHPKLARLAAQNKAANEPMFALMRLIASEK